MNHVLADVNTLESTTSHHSSFSTIPFSGFQNAEREGKRAAGCLQAGYRCLNKCSVGLGFFEFRIKGSLGYK